jgi:CRP/FNR family transcriptional regulator
MAREGLSEDTVVSAAAQHRRALHEAPLCSGLTEAERDRLTALAHFRSYPKGSTVIAEGEIPKIAGIVIEGVLKLQKTQADGRQQIVGLLVPADMFGRVFNGAAEFAIEAATDATLCCFDRRRFEALVVEVPHLEHRVMLSVMDELDSAREWITLLGAQTVSQRLASFMLILCRRWPSIGCGLTPDRRRVQITLPIGRADLAQYLSTTVETISRTLQGMARDGLIEIVTPNQFVVRDLRRLIAASATEDFDAEAIMEQVSAEP